MSPWCWRLCCCYHQHLFPCFDRVGRWCCPIRAEKVRWWSPWPQTVWWWNWPSPGSMSKGWQRHVARMYLIKFHGARMSSQPSCIWKLIVVDVKFWVSDIKITSLPQFFTFIRNVPIKCDFVGYHCNSEGISCIIVAMDLRFEPQSYWKQRSVFNGAELVEAWPNYRVGSTHHYSSAVTAFLVTLACNRGAWAPCCN